MASELGLKKTQSQTTNNENREAGKAWEDVLYKRAQLNGVLIRRNHITAKHSYNGKLRATESQNLDFTICFKGITGFFDAKSFDETFFKFSEIKDTQLKTAIEYNFHGVPAGFIVYFREVNRIAFYSGNDLRTIGPGNRILLTDGLLLGALESFDLRLLFK